MIFVKESLIRGSGIKIVVVFRFVL